MKLKIDEITFNLVLDDSRLKNVITPIIFLHGYTGSAEDWNFTINQLPNEYLPIAVDLIGHGKTESPAEIIHYSATSQIEQLKRIIEMLGFSEVVLCGYSMGGRLALSFTLEHPKLVESLILESSTPGIRDESERKQRIDSDNEIADMIVNKGINHFIKYWMNIPLFETLKKLPPNKYQEIIETKLNNNRAGLANSLRGFGAGIMPDNWDKVKNLAKKTLLITGELDDKFTSINRNMLNLLPNAEHRIVSACGHNVHLENPEEFTILVNQFLSS